MRQLFFLIALLLCIDSSVYADGNGIYDVVVAADGSGDYATLQEAIDARPTGHSERWLIFVKAGTYKGHTCVPADKGCMSIIGEGADVTMLSDDRLSGGDNAYPVDKGATLVILADDVLLQGLAIINNHGFRAQTGPQALAFYAKGDKIAIEHCALMSYQDTYRTSNSDNGRNYVAHSLIVGAVDFIYGNGNAWIESCLIFVNRKSGGWIVAPRHGEQTRWGYVFSRCALTAEGDPRETTVWLGRPWKNKPRCVFINNRAELTIPPEGWWPTMGGLPTIFAEYNTTDAEGNQVDLSKRRDRYYTVDKETRDTTWCTAQNRLTSTEAERYTLQNVMGGNDNWHPDALFAQDQAPRGYAIIKHGKIVRFSRKKARNALTINRYGCIDRNYSTEM